MLNCGYKPKLITAYTHTDKELLPLIAEGDEQAFRNLFDLYKLRLFTFAEEITKSAADAEEIVQDAFTKLWINRKDATNIDSPGNYLFIIVRNRCFDHLRKTARDKKLVERAWILNGSPDNSLQEHIQEKEFTEIIDQALSALSEQKQRVYRLSRDGGYSHEEIANLTGLSKSRINNILVETIKHIKASLDGYSAELALIFWLTAWEQLFL
ncbi:MAG: RNA polymerase sigma-70 factor [Chitinophagaceae bacterium]|nr:RNA polymerase sigma-70 factor [Chitinophagaceae bacterium]